MIEASFIGPCWIALYIAAQEGHGDVVQKLINAGATVDIQTKGGTTALDTSDYLDETVIQLLIKNAMNASDARDHQNDNIIAIYGEQISVSSKNMDLNKGFSLHITNSSISSVHNILLPNEKDVCITDPANSKIIALGGEVLCADLGDDAYHVCDFGIMYSC